MSKRILGSMMGVVIAMMMFPVNMAFAAGGVVISEFTANGGSNIYEGNDFNLVLKIKNESSDKITAVGVSFGAGASFQPSSGGRDRSFCDEIAAGQSSAEVAFLMFYTGGEEKNLPITITYTDSLGAPQSVNTSIYIRNATPEEPSDPTPVNPDTTKSKPVLTLAAGDIPEGKAGDMVTLPITLNNTSGYEARDIKITPVFSTTDNPFSIEQLLMSETIDKILSKQSGSVSFQLKIDRLAAAKTYTLPVKIEYTNIYKDSYTEEKVVYIRITNTNLPPQLVVRDAKASLQEINEEQKFSVTFEIWNMGTLEAENVTIDLEKNDNLYILDNMTKHYLFEMKGLQSKEITYNLKAKKDIASGTYGITVLLQHDGIQSPEKYTVYVNVNGKEKDEEEEKKDDINIITENILAPEGTVLVEQPFTASFTVKNTGTTAAEAVKVTVEGGEKILPRSLNVLNLTNVKPGESVPVSFSFIASKDSETRTYPIKAVIEYKNNEETVRKEQYMGVLIQNPEKDKEKEEEEDTTRNTIPKIIISEYSTDPVMVNAGDNFTLRMKFLNTNKEKAVENMKITLIVNESSEKTGSVFSPVQSSNTFYIAHLDPGETSEKEMMMYTIPDAQAKTYVVKASFEYEYEEKDQLKTNSMEDLFGIPVVQPAKLETSDVIVSEPAVMGEPVYLSSEFYNMGKVTLSNLMVKVEGNFDTKESNYFVGNFEMGMSDFYEAPVTPLVPGETNGLLVFTFEDSAGKEHRIEKEFTVNAMESSPVMNPGFPIDPNTGMPMDPGMMDPGMEGMKGPRLPIIPIAIGAGVVLLIVVFIIIRKRRKKKKEMMLDEDI
jgi:hypothetical protein